MTRPSTILTWDPEDPRYQCCCDSLHIVKGSRAIGAVEAIGVVLALGVGLREATEGEAAVGGCLLGIAGLASIMVLILAVGLHRESARLLLPHIALQAVVVTVLSVGLIAVCVLLVKGGPGDEGALSPAARTIAQAEATAWRNLSYGLLVGLFCGAGLEIWFFFVIYRTYHFFKDKDFACGMGIDQDTRPVSRPKPVEV